MVAAARGAGGIDPDAGHPPAAIERRSLEADHLDPAGADEADVPRRGRAAEAQRVAGPGERGEPRRHPRLEDERRGGGEADRDRPPVQHAVAGRAGERGEDEPHAHQPAERPRVEALPVQRLEIRCGGGAGGVDLADQRGETRRRHDRHEHVAALGRLLLVRLRDGGGRVHPDGGAAEQPHQRRLRDGQLLDARARDGAADAGQQAVALEQLVAAGRQRELEMLDRRPHRREQAEGQHREHDQHADLEGDDRRGPAQPAPHAFGGRQEAAQTPGLEIDLPHRTGGGGDHHPAARGEQPVQQELAHVERDEDLGRLRFGGGRRAGVAAPADPHGVAELVHRVERQHGQLALGAGAGAGVEPDHRDAGQPVPGVLHQLDVLDAGVGDVALALPEQAARDHDLVRIEAVGEREVLHQLEREQRRHRGQQPALEVLPPAGPSAGATRTGRAVRAAAGRASRRPSTRAQRASSAGGAAASRRRPPTQMASPPPAGASLVASPRASSASRTASAVSWLRPSIAIDAFSVPAV